MSFDSSQAAHVELRSVVAERTRPLLAWVGAGASAEAGLPTWAGLKGVLVESLRQKAGSMDAEAQAINEKKATFTEQERNPWVAFSMLKTSLGQTTFRDSVKKALSPAPSAKVPKVYKLLWKTGINGILDLNLDRLATRALLESGRVTVPQEFGPRQIAASPGTITSGRPFVANLHGVVENVQSWVFTKEDLGGLLRDERYLEFLATCLGLTTMIFVGISADDLAVGGHLEQLSQWNVDVPTHFWITDRTDKATDAWAESVGIRVIRYANASGKHEELVECLEDLASYVAVEDEVPPPPVRPDVQVPSLVAILPPPEDLVGWEAEPLRELLNGHALELLREETPEAFADYEAFTARYDEAIYHAWYTNTRDGANQLLGYKLESEVARGAFGKVFLARSADGERVAIKVLLEEIRNKSELLQCFRRGVRSMKILRSHGFEGVVEYRGASEIPAFVAMDWIDGPNLVQARAARELSSWKSLLWVSLGLVEIIHEAHALPERVLHRDIRPSNVMLKDWYSDHDNARLVVLDFDLSWHRGAHEQSVVHTPAAGYMAPEQFSPVKGVSTRSAGVDSFGIGMTLLFLLTGRDPVPGEHLHVGFEEAVAEAARRFAPATWLSTQRRFARVVLACTKDRQAERWDLAQMSTEFGNLLAAQDERPSITSAELVAEELACHCECMDRYVWDDDTVAAEQDLPSGLRVVISGMTPTGIVKVSLSFAGSGTEDRRRLSKHLPTAVRSAGQALRAGGWKVTAEKAEAHSGVVDATMPATAVVRRLVESARSIDKAVDQMRFH